MALSVARNPQRFGLPTMQIRAPEAPREARRLQRPPLESGAPNFYEFRAVERAVWPVGQAGTASSRAGVSRPGPISTGGPNDGI
eukprot:15467391-Alexandrium_andersonii.AAC.1